MNLHIILFLTYIYSVSCKNVLYINGSRPVKYIDKYQFISAALDTILIYEGFKDFDMKNDRFIQLVSNFYPAYLRIGGNMADSLTFSESSSENTNLHLNNSLLLQLESCAYDELNCNMDFPNFTMTGDQWIQLNKFASKIRAKIIFDLNALTRNEDGSWNSDNAKKLIEFSNRNEFNIDWQLGNEPNAFKHVFNKPVNASQLAKDFVSLRNILNGYGRYKKSQLVGPDTTRPTGINSSSAKYFREFLESFNDSKVLNAITFHQYYLNGRTATLEDFLNPLTFSYLEEQINIIKSIAATTSFANTSIWLTETSSAYGGGAPGLSNTFAGSFLWLDKLGLAAKNDIKVVVRQSLFRDHYALIDNNYEPTPDWWVSVVYRKFMGSYVMECNLDASDNVRLYCQCSRLAYNFDPTVVVFGINLSNTASTVQINGIRPSGGQFAYVLTSADKNTLMSKNILLNGELLKLTETGNAPENFKSEPIDITKPLVMPAYSLVFWLIPSRSLRYC